MFLLKYLVYSQIWLHCLTEDCHFSYITKKEKEKKEKKRPLRFPLPSSSPLKNSPLQELRHTWTAEHHNEEQSFTSSTLLSPKILSSLGASTLHMNSWTPLWRTEFHHARQVQLNLLQLLSLCNLCNSILLSPKIISSLTSLDLNTHEQLAE